MSYLWSKEKKSCQMNAPFKLVKSTQISVSASGKVHLPAELRKKLSVENGGKLIVFEDEEGVKIRTIKAHLDALQALAAPYMKGDSVDKFLADRKAEAQREWDEDR